VGSHVANFGFLLSIKPFNNLFVSLVFKVMLFLKLFTLMFGD